jgi:aromatic ring-opening dioxygenase catalytic subunit (LigB family)
MLVNMNEIIKLFLRSSHRPFSNLSYSIQSNSLRDHQIDLGRLIAQLFDDRLLAIASGSTRNHVLSMANLWGVCVCVLNLLMLF